MKKLCLLAFIVILTFHLSAQTEKGYVRLKNGTILKGKYQYSNDLKTLKMESAGNLWVFEVEEVDRISHKRPKSELFLNEDQVNSPLFFRTEIGVLVGNSNNSQSAPFSFTGSINYSINENFSAGIGAGLEFYKESYLPAFINLEYKFRNSSSTPYLFLKGGYQVSLEESGTIYHENYYPIWSSFRPWPNYQQETMDAKGGVLINPGIGYQQMFSSRFGMAFAFGYQFHRLQYQGENDYNLDIDYNRLTIKLGIIFN